MVNLLDTPVEVRVLRGLKHLEARDLLGVGQQKVKALKPETPVLAGM